LFGKDLEGSDLALIEIRSRHFTGRTEENHDRSQSGCPVEIQTEDLPNTSEEPYRYTIQSVAESLGYNAM
jgi:hypothetical protein